MIPKQPYRGSLDFVTAARDLAYFERLTDDLIGWLERRGCYMQSASTEPMAPEDVVTGSQLAEDLAA